jgi:predicted DNA-binding protein
MAKGVTTSIRLESDLRDQLEHASQVLHRGKNWIIQQALQKYLAEMDFADLAKEARRQSLIACRAARDESWEDLEDDVEGWE